jgi:hypothetical protein
MMRALRSAVINRALLPRFIAGRYRFRRHSAFQLLDAIANNPQQEAATQCVSASHMSKCNANQLGDSQ